MLMLMLLVCGPHLIIKRPEDDYFLTFEKGRFQKACSGVSSSEEELPALAGGGGGLKLAGW